jgi:thiol-disulfide isomerase/thioredoxin
MSNRPGRKIARKHSHERVSHHERQDRQHRIIIIGLLIIVVIGAGIATIAVLATGGEADDQIAINGTPLPPFENDGVDEAIGMKAPVFRTNDLRGYIKVTGGGGGPNDTAKLIGFVAHWCPACQAELPIVVDWLDQNPLPDRVEMVMISTWEDESRDNYPAEDWFHEVGWPETALGDSSDGKIASAYGLVSTPYWVVLDDANFVLERFSGGVGEEELDSMVALAANSLD